MPCASSVLLVRSSSLAKEDLLPGKASLSQPCQGSAAVNLCPAEFGLEIDVIAQQVPLLFPSQRCIFQVRFSASVTLDGNYDSLCVAETGQIFCYHYHFEERKVFIEL